MRRAPSDSSTQLIPEEAGFESCANARGVYQPPRRQAGRRSGCSLQRRRAHALRARRGSRLLLVPTRPLRRDALSVPDGRAARIRRIVAVVAAPRVLADVPRARRARARHTLVLAGAPKICAHGVPSAVHRPAPRRGHVAVSARPSGVRARAGWQPASRVVDVRWHRSDRLRSAHSDRAAPAHLRIRRGAHHDPGLHLRERRLQLHARPIGHVPRRPAGARAALVVAGAARVRAQPRRLRAAHTVRRPRPSSPRASSPRRRSFISALPRQIAALFAGTTCSPPRGTRSPS